MRNESKEIVDNILNNYFVESSSTIKAISENIESIRKSHAGT